MLTLAELPDGAIFSPRGRDHVACGCVLRKIGLYGYSPVDDVDIITVQVISPCDWCYNFWARTPESHYGGGTYVTYDALANELDGRFG